jgi:hypothetical protein
VVINVVQQFLALQVQEMQRQADAGTGAPSVLFTTSPSEERRRNVTPLTGGDNQQACPI